jgi:hypothetical protein
MNIFVWQKNHPIFTLIYQPTTLIQYICLMFLLSFQAAAKGHLHMAKLLLKQGADSNAVDNFNTTPASEAKKFSHTAVTKLFEGIEVVMTNLSMGDIETDKG